MAGNKAFRHVETLFVQVNQVRADQNKSLFVLFLRFVLVSTNLSTLYEYSLYMLKCLIAAYILPLFIV